MSKVRWGIIGPGIIAHEFVQDFQFVTNAEVVAVASRSIERAENFAKQYQIRSAYGNYEALYNDPYVDAVYIATPHNYHCSQSIEALEKGKAVLCEKPITTNAAELHQIIEAAYRTRNYLAEGMWTYFLPAILKAQEWIKAGRLGKILHVKADFGYPIPYDPKDRKQDPALAGGCLLELGIYPVALTWMALQKDPHQMSVVAKKYPNGVESDVNIQFQYDDVVASLHASYACKLHNWAFIIGEKGYIAIPDFWRARDCFFYEGEQLIEHFQDQRQGNGFEFEITTVSDEILAGSLASKVVPHESSLKFQQHLTAIRDSFSVTYAV